ncbi:MAG: phosphonate C-P lyase system protein PhnG, partial [Pseudomonadota bacterium]|nr:phosphonate C-P lyase system protein PhnG [Pseudomonadota bacterium]
GGSAAAFNLGEMTLTRCVVATTDQGTGARLIGHGHVAGRDRRHAELIARFDAVFQDSTTDAAGRDEMLADLANQQQAAHAESAAATAATKVDFFTLVRGE